MINHEWTYPATIVRWVDGDTVDVTVDVGFRGTRQERLRLLGVDTPERGEEGFNEARAYCEYLAPQYTRVVIRTSKSDSFGRWLVEIWTGTEMIGEALLAKGLARVWM